jgi:sugar-specific transcriptional regulator TrmB
MQIKDYLDEFGLGTYEQKAYLALVDLGSAKAPHLCKKSGVPYGRIYDILSKLEERGLIICSNNEPKIFTLLDPRISFNRIIKEKEKQIESFKLHIPTIKITPLSAPEKESVVLRGKDKQLKVIRNMQDEAEKEILSIPGVFEPDSGSLISKIRAIKRGVKVRMIISQIGPKNEESIRKLSKEGVLFRMNLFPGMRLAIKDQKEAIISIAGDNPKERLSVYTKRVIN